MGLNVKFTAGVIAIVIVGFSVSAYVFSSQPLDGLTDSIDIMMIDKSQYIEKIDECVSVQSVGDVALNSFTHKWATEYKLKIQKAETSDKVERLMDEFYNITSCKR